MHKQKRKFKLEAMTTELDEGFGVVREKRKRNPERRLPRRQGRTNDHGVSPETAPLPAIHHHH
jgi:hypothetical protein